jgi:hypothetical protein
VTGQSDFIRFFDNFFQIFIASDSSNTVLQYAMALSLVMGFEKRYKKCQMKSLCRVILCLRVKGL